MVLEDFQQTLLIGGSTLVLSAMNSSLFVGTTSKGFSCTGAEGGLWLAVSLLTNVVPNPEHRSPSISSR